MMTCRMITSDLVFVAAKPLFPARQPALVAPRPRLLDDLCQFIKAVDDEIPDPLAAPGVADRAARLDRVHEMNFGIAEHLPDERYLRG